MGNMAYLDNSATTRPYDAVIDYISEINRNVYGNPSSLHRKGLEAEKLVRKTRSIISDTLGVTDKEIYFTSGGTESNNLAILGFLRGNPRKGKHVITTRIEHPSVMEVFKHLSETGYRVDFIDVDTQGVINLDMLQKHIGSDTSLISIMLVNNETGTVQPVEEIARIRDACGSHAVIHVDAVQAYGKFMLRPEKTGIDMLSLSSHKIHGPKGVGAVYINRKCRVAPVIFGGGQEAAIRSGTENVAGICGFGLAAGMACNSMESNYCKVRELKNLLLKEIGEKVRHYKVLSPDNASPYILNISFCGVKAEVLLHYLEQEGIYVSTGSACSSRKKRSSHVLTAMGLKTQDIEGAIRISLSHLNTAEEMRYTAGKLAEILAVLQKKEKGMAEACR